MENIILAVLAALVVAYVVIVEDLDWAGRIDYLATKFPRIATFLRRLVDNKPMRLALLALALLLVIRVLYELATLRPEATPIAAPTMSTQADTEEVKHLRAQVAALEKEKEARDRAIETLTREKRDAQRD